MQKSLQCGLKEAFNVTFFIAKKIRILFPFCWNDVSWSDDFRVTLTHISNGKWFYSKHIFNQVPQSPLNERSTMILSNRCLVIWVSFLSFFIIHCEWVCHGVTKITGTITSATITIISKIIVIFLSVVIEYWYVPAIFDKQQNRLELVDKNIQPFYFGKTRLGHWFFASWSDI